jgi:uncharacterized damage-inducible protein DinB
MAGNKPGDMASKATDTCLDNKSMHTRTIFLLFLCSYALLDCPGLRAQDSLLLRESVQKWQNATAYTLEVARAMPWEYYDFKPVEEEFTFAQQLEHMAGNMQWLAGKYLRGQAFTHPLLEQTTRTPEESLSLLEISLAFAEETLAHYPADSLNKVHDFFAGPLSSRQLIHLLHDHHTHHRGQLIVYLRLKGIRPPRYRGW